MVTGKDPSRLVEQSQGKRPGNAPHKTKILLNYEYGDTVQNITDACFKLPMAFKSGYRILTPARVQRLSGKWMCLCMDAFSVFDTAACGDYKLTARKNQNTGQCELVLNSEGGAGHKATYRNYILLDKGGEIIGRPPITEDVAAFIVKYFNQRGHTESFNVYEDDLKSGTYTPRARTLDPAQIRHRLVTNEESFTATGSKLTAHWPVFHKLRDTGVGSIIRATMTNHQVCSSRCQFCSTIARNKKDSITLQEAKDFVSALYFDQAEYNRKNFPSYNEEYKALTGKDIRLRGLILSGGGQPNLWPHFVEFVEWLAGLDIDLGLITNGFPQKLPEDLYNHFQWVRISITPPDASAFYPEGRFERQYVPSSLIRNDKVTVGYSYVDGPWADDEIYRRMDKAATDNGFKYVRVLVDCNLGRTEQLQAHRDLAERLFRLNFIDETGRPTSRIFQQLKYHGADQEADDLWNDGQCFLQSYNVFWDTTGHEENGFSYCYPCDSVTVLTDEGGGDATLKSARKFDSSRWGTVPNTEVSRLYTEKLRPYFDPRTLCRSCLFTRNNQTAKTLSSLQNYDNLEVPDHITHVSFP